MFFLNGCHSIDSKAVFCIYLMLISGCFSAFVLGNDPNKKALQYILRESRWCRFGCGIVIEQVVIDVFYCVLIDADEEIDEGGDAHCVPEGWDGVVKKGKGKNEG